MYIKNIAPSIIGDISYKLKFTEGSIVFGKVLFNDGSTGAIKLFDGTIIPAIFLSENNKEDNSFIKFKIEACNDEFITLTRINDEKIINENSISSITSKLSIPFEKGREIIYSLLKFNLPATDEHILTLYKNLEFVDKVKKLGSKELLTFLREKINNEINYESKEFKIAQNLLTSINSIDIDFLTFLIENKIPSTVEKTTMLQDLLKNNFILNNLIDSHTSNQSSEESSDSELKSVKEQIRSNSFTDSLMNLDLDGVSFISTSLKDNVKNTHLSEIIEKIEDTPKFSKSNINNTHMFLEKLLEKLLGSKSSLVKDFSENFKIKELRIDTPEDIINSILSRSNTDENTGFNNLKTLIEKIDLVNHLTDNYSIYNFNTKINNNNFRNNIIIKNKYKGSKYVDSGNIKAFITVDAPYLGLVEGYIHKRNDDLVVSLKVKEEYINIIKKHIDVLKNKLLNNGYRTINISLDKIITPNNIILLSSFFNDYGFKELDVKV